LKEGKQTEKKKVIRKNKHKKKDRKKKPDAWAEFAFLSAKEELEAFKAKRAMVHSLKTKKNGK
jgi:hypothetical protein